VLTKNQAQAASEALLHPALSGRAARGAKIAERRRLFAKRKWLGGGALFGLAIGCLVSDRFPNHSFTSAIVGLIVGAAIGALFSRLRA
jgi:hypothetical protein